MNRRDLIKRAGQALVGVSATAIGVKATTVDVSFAPTSWRVNAAKRIVSESGEMWLAVRDRSSGRNPILIAFDGERGVEVARGKNIWKLTERTLTAAEIEGRDLERNKMRSMFSDFPQFKTARLPKIGDRPVDKDLTLRAYIHNGRAPRWLLSFDGYDQIKS